MYKTTSQISSIKALLLASIISLCTIVIPASKVFANDTVADFSLTNSTSTTPVKQGTASYVTVSLIANLNLDIDALQSYFSTLSAQDGQASHITLTDFADYSKDQDDYDYDINNGLVWLVNDHGSSFSTKETIFQAIYKVDESTPAGEYDISVSFKTFTQHGDRSPAQPETLTTKIIVSNEQDSNNAFNPNTGNVTSQGPDASFGLLWVAIAGTTVAFAGFLGYKYLVRRKS